MHICFSDYSALWPAVLELDDCLELQLEFANRDSRELGTRRRRPARATPRRSACSRSTAIRTSAWACSTSTPTSSSRPELVRDRILYAVDVLGDPERIQVNPDCGLRTRSWDVVYEKLANMVQGTRLAEEVLNRASAVAGGL